MYKNNPTSEATIKETATSIVEVFEKYLLSIDAIVPCSDIEEEIIENPANWVVVPLLFKECDD